MPIGLGDLAEAAVAWEARVNELVGSDADIAAYVRQLEERDDDQIDEHDLPSGDSLAASWSASCATSGVTRGFTRLPKASTRELHLPPPRQY